MVQNLPAVGISLFAFAAFLIIWSGQVQSRKLERARQEALDLFRSSQVESADPRLAFSGATATIVKVEEPANPHRHHVSDFTLTVIARNDAGEYFMFKSTKPKHFIKYLTHAVAKQVLKRDYMPPSAEA